MDRAEQAVDASDIKQVQTYASTVWAEAYLDGARTKADLKTAVTEGMKDIDTSDYAIIVTERGVDVYDASKTLGGQVKSAVDYGKTVNYTANGIDGWQVFYKQKVDGEEYVYLISTENMPNDMIPTNIPGILISDGEVFFDDEVAIEVADVQRPSLWLANWINLFNFSFPASYIKDKKFTTYLLDEDYWIDFKNIEEYGDNVIGAIGAPTVEMFIASWNEREAILSPTTFSPVTLEWRTYMGGYYELSIFPRLYPRIICG